MYGTKMHSKPVHWRFLCNVVIVVVGSLLNQGTLGADPPSFIEVRNPKTLSVETLRCQRIPLGEVDDYKPTIALLPDGELLLSMFSGRRLAGGKIAEQTVLYRSADGGMTWSRRETPDIAGREPALSVTKEGTVFITAHLLAQDVRNKNGYTHSYLHRSLDGGRTWTTTRVEPEEFRPRTTGLTTRNVLQLADGSLVLAVSERPLTRRGEPVIVVLRPLVVGDDHLFWRSISFETTRRLQPISIHG